MKQETTIYTMQIKQCSIQMHSKGKFKQLHKPIYKNSYVLQIIRGGPKRERRAIRNKKKYTKHSRTQNSFAIYIGSLVAKITFCLGCKKKPTISGASTWQIKEQILGNVADQRRQQIVLGNFNLRLSTGKRNS